MPKIKNKFKLSLKLLTRYFHGFSNMEAQIKRIILRNIWNDIKKSPLKSNQIKISMCFEK